MKFVSIKEYPDTIEDAALHHLENRNVMKAIADIKEFLLADGGYGIALPQVGIPLRIVVGRFEKDSPLQVMINPTFKEEKGKGKAWQEESCFSLRKLPYKMKRWNKIKATWIDESGNKIDKVLRKYPATVFMHEYDHLYNWKEKIKEIDDADIQRYIQDYE